MSQEEHNDVPENDLPESSPPQPLEGEEVESDHEQAEPLDGTMVSNPAAMSAQEEESEGQQPPQGEDQGEEVASSGEVHDVVETGDSPVYAPLDDAALVDFEMLRRKIQAFSENGEASQALQFLQRIASFPDSTRHIPDNVWLYRTIGDLHYQLVEHHDALEAYRTAYAIDPRDLKLLQPFIKALLEQGFAEEALGVIQSMLLYHKRRLGEGELIQVYQRMGSCYEALDKLDKARASYEKALDQQQDPMALAGLLRVVSQQGSPDEMIKVRQRLIRSITEVSARAMAIVALGDDWISHFNDSQRALDAYEQAFAEDPGCRVAVEKVAHVARESEDWRRVARAYFTLSRMSTDGPEEAEWLIKASLIARDHLWEPEKALAGFKRALELDPMRLDAFKIVTSILVDASDWEGLKNAYVQLIAILRDEPDVDNELMVLLWHKLGELYKTHLKNPSEAIVAFDQASQLAPRNIELHKEVIELTEKNSDNLNLALVHLKMLGQLQPSDDKLLDRIGRVYMRQKEIDQAYCVFRTLSYKGATLDEQAQGFVDKFSKPIYRAPKQPLKLDLLQRYIFTSELNRHISKIFTIIKPTLAEWAGQTRAKYGLRRRDRLRLEDPLTFNNIYQSVGGLLQYPALPEVWRKPEQAGLINGALLPDGLIVGDSLLGSGREKQIAFIVGKQLFLFLAPFYLAAIRPSDLQAYLMLAMMLADPEQYSFQLNADLQSAYKALQKGVRGELFDKLQRAVAALVKESGKEVNVNAWREAVEDSANRVGFLFCDDLKTCEDYLMDESQRISERPIKDRMQSLINFSLSDEYFELRDLLGIRVRVS